MVRDYAKKTFSYKKRKIKKSSRPWGLYILLILLFSLFCTGLYYKTQANKPTPPVTHNTKIKPLPTTKPRPAADKPVSPVFEFYTLLPKMTASSSPGLSSQQAPDPRQTGEKIEKNTNNKNYFLQIATLKHQKDADALKAKLLLLGFDVLVKPVPIKNEMMYRVSTGPYSSLSDLHADQNRLRENHIPSS